MKRTVSGSIARNNLEAGVILIYRDPITKENAMKRSSLIFLFLLLPLIAISCSGTAWVTVYNDHETITIPDDQSYEPTLEVTVNGERKTISPSPYNDEEWEISWVNLMPWEEVTVRASVSYPALSNPGLYEESFRVKDGDEEDVYVTSCTGYSP